ncbi:MAG: restriction endonuclease subunit S, partial [Thiothrix sp.]|nr:restriction endonuclease subunit S [Thiothrix sp.]
MSGVSYLDKLLDGVAVEWKPLDEVSVKISSGGTPKTGVAEFYDGNIPWLRTQEVDFGEIWDTGVKITESGVKNSSAKWIPANCVIVAMYGATVGKIGINKIPMTTNQACANIELDKKIADYRYVFHFLSNQYEYIKSLGAGSQTNINAGIVKKLNVPIPCPDDPQKSLKIQAEIVRILDTFTELTAELTA